MAHLCRRVGFGATSSEIATLAKLPSRAAAVDRLLNDVRHNAPLTFDIAPPVMTKTAEYCEDDAWRQINLLGGWWLDRMVRGRLLGTGKNPAPVLDKLVLFLHGYLVSSAEKDSVYCSHPAIRQQHLLFRRRALGDYETLLRELSRDPAMIHYLDNDPSTKDEPNENYARELMELFSVGVGKYTQADVVAAARAGTGYHTDEAGSTLVLDASLHDTGQKTFFGITGNWDLAYGFNPNASRNVVSYLCRTKKWDVAKYVGKLLFQFYAHFTPSDATINTVATAFVKSGKLVLKDALRAVLVHPDFYSTAAKGGKAKNPVDWVVALYKSLGIAIPRDDSGLDVAQWPMESMGLTLFYQPSVYGWWRRPETIWLGAPSFQSKASLAGWMISDVMDKQPNHRVWRGATMTVPNAVSDMAGLFGVTLAAGTPTRIEAERLLTEARAYDVWNTWAQQWNLAMFVVLSPEFMTN